MLNVGSLFIDFSQMFGTELLIDGEFFLRYIFLPDMHIVGAQPVMRIGQIGIKRKSAHILRNRLSYWC